MHTISDWEQWNTVFSDSKAHDRWVGYIREFDDEVKSFIFFDPESNIQDSNCSGALHGIPFAVKDNIAVRSMPLTCGSKILSSFQCPYTATAVQHLQNAGAVVVGKTNLDEFGMGSSTQNSAIQVTANPWDLSKVPGGSSGGSAAAVAAGFVPFALGSDTGGSIRQPAAFCGVYGLKPTYGAVSRYGLVAYASSLEVIGVIAKTVSIVEEVFSVVRNEDEKDQTSLPVTGSPVVPESFTVGIPVEITEMEIHPAVRSSLEGAKEMLEKSGNRIVGIELPSLEYVVPTYYIIAAAEASSNLSRFDGIRYGYASTEAENPDERIEFSRKQGFGFETKMRILLGTYVLRSGFYDQYYAKAQKIRTAIRSDFDRAFQQADLVLMPVYPVPPFARGDKGLDPFSQKLADIFTSTANLAGIPAMSFPTSMYDGLPLGMQLLAPAFCENYLFRICADLEQVYPSPTPPDWKPWWSE